MFDPLQPIIFMNLITIPNDTKREKVHWNCLISKKHGIFYFEIMLKKTTHGLTERTDVLFICKLTDHQMNVFAVNYKKCSSEESSLFDFCYAKHPYMMYI